MTSAAGQRLKDHIALISGAGGDIGRAVSEAYAKAGAQVILVDNNQALLERTDDAISAIGGKAALVVLDLTDLEKVANLGPALYERYGRLDSVTASHGVRSTPTPIGHIAHKEWDKTLRNNLTALWQLIQTTLPLLHQAPNGRLLGVTSDVTQTTPAFSASYTIAKAGCEALLKTLQAETVNSTVDVCLVDPGDLLTRTRRAVYPYQKPGDAPKAETVAEKFVDLLAMPATDLPASVSL